MKAPFEVGDLVRESGDVVVYPVHIVHNNDGWFIIGIFDEASGKIYFRPSGRLTLHKKKADIRRDKIQKLL